MKGYVNVYLGNPANPPKTIKDVHPSDKIAFQGMDSTVDTLKKGLAKLSGRKLVVGQAYPVWFVYTESAGDTNGSGTALDAYGEAVEATETPKGTDDIPF